MLVFVFVPVLVFVPVPVPVPVLVFVLVPVLVFVPVFVLVPVPVLVFVPEPALVFVLVAPALFDRLASQSPTSISIITNTTPPTARAIFIFGDIVYRVLIFSTRGEKPNAARSKKI